MLKDRLIGFIGSGNMGEALIKGLISSKRLNQNQIIACDKDRERLSRISQDYNIDVFSNASELANKADIILLAVKPQNIDEVIDEINGELSEKKLLLSIAAGITTGHIAERLYASCPIVRIMPNTPALVMEGISALYPTKGVNDKDLKDTAYLFKAIGKVVIIEEESLMDAVTGLSGSGPGFVFLFMEALIDGGVKMGLKREVASLLAMQTVQGAARLAIETGRHLGELKDMVTSPGGTTIAGLSHMEKMGFKGITIDAIEKATLKSKELSKRGK